MKMAFGFFWNINNFIVHNFLFKIIISFFHSSIINITNKLKYIKIYLKYKIKYTKYIKIYYI